MRALVLGGNGFVGSHIVDGLLARGGRVRVFDREQERYGKAKSSVEYVFGDFGDSLKLIEALQGVDIVYHCISGSVPSTSNADPVNDIRVNLVNTVKLLDQMVKYQVGRIVFLSSGGTVYGNPRQLPVPEDHPLTPISSYGIVKVAIENYLQMYHLSHGLSPVILRPSNPYGPRQGHAGVQGVIATFLQKMAAGEPLMVWGDGSIVRDFLYVSDLAELCILAGESQEVGIFNAGSGEGQSIADIVRIVSEVVGFAPEVKHLPGRSFDVREVVLDIRKAKAAFGWRPSVDIREGIAKHWKWLQHVG